MGQLPLIRPVLAIMILMLSLGAEASVCKEVTISSKIIRAAEKIDLCFLEDSSYFISRNCKNLECNFIQRLKVAKFSPTIHERPGEENCRFLGGGVDIVTISGLTQTVPRCIFKNEHSSISLNLLESWDGKKFAGPATSIEF